MRGPQGSQPAGWRVQHSRTFRKANGKTGGNQRATCPGRPVPSVPKETSQIQATEKELIPVVFMMVLHF